MKSGEDEDKQELKDRSENKPEKDDDLEAALDKLGELGPWLWMVFFLTCSPGLFNVWHNTSYVFIGSDLPHWCDVSELRDTNWTDEQIRTIVSGDPVKSSCFARAWNYTLLAGLGYEEAVDLTTSTPFPGTFQCHRFHYVGSSIMSEWNLVCGKTALRTTVQMAVALGKFIGSFVFGFVADKWGRKRVFVIASGIYIGAGMVSSFTRSYLVFVFARLFLGVAGSGTYNSAFTLMTEVCSTKHRSLLGNLYNLPYAVGLVLLSMIAYHVQDDWQMLQLILCAPTFLLVLHIFLLPESPRWLMSQGRREEAWSVVETATRGRIKPRIGPALSTIETEKIVQLQGEELPVPIIHRLPWRKRVTEFFSKVTDLFVTPDLRWRILICYFTWFVSALSYYALALNADNFSSNRYIYIAVAGGVEGVSNILPVPVLKVIGRRLCSGVLFFIAAFALLSILTIPQENSMVIMAVAMVGRLCIGAVYSVVNLYTSELFPIENRNTAVGTCSTISHLGSISAPYVVDLLGAVAWFIPSTLCGIMSLLAGLLVLLLPETKDKELCNNVKELIERDDDRVNIKNFCVCK